VLSVEEKTGGFFQAVSVQNRIWIFVALRILDNEFAKVPRAVRDLKTDTL
jgi:hypothetical protein